MEVFGCCSSYKECSQARECLHKDDEVYDGCQYRKNLESGKIFYLDGYKASSDSSTVTINNTITDSVKKSSRASKKEEHFVYLKCFNRAFKVAVKDKRYWYTRRLKQHHAEAVKELFDSKGIPYITSLDNVKCIIDSPTKEGPTCANSRVVFSLWDREYIIYNFNNYLIKETISKTIVQAFKKRGIDCRYELIGLNHEYVPEEEPIKPDNKDDVLIIYVVDFRERYKREKLEAGKNALPVEPVDKKNYTQISIFELMTG